MEKLTWFKFVISDWMMGKIQKCPEITQARFLRLCCLYWNKECMLTIEDAEIEIDEDHLKVLVGKKILIKENGFVKIKFLDEQNSEVLDLSEKRREAVKARWEKLKNKNTIVSKTNTIVIQSDTDKSRVDKSRVDKSILINNSIDVRKLKFSQSLIPFVSIYGKDGIREFCDYWTEPNKSNTKFKQETEKTWDTTLRLKRWFKNDFNKPTIKLNKAVDQSQNKDFLNG